MTNTDDQKTVPKAQESGLGATGGETDRPKTPSPATASMRDMLNYMTDPKGANTVERTKVAKQWNKVIKNREKI